MRRFAGGSHEGLLAALLSFVDAHLGTEPLRGVGHGVVHGGSRFTARLALMPTHWQRSTR